jgi:hypothetical protein
MMKTLPERWCLKVTSENISEVAQWRTAGICVRGGYIMYEGYIGKIKGYWERIKPDYCTEISFGQFKELVLNKTETKMEKKQIGWKLIKPEYNEAAKAIALRDRSDWGSGNYDFAVDSAAETRLRTAAVLNLWFEPVYENRFKVGDWIMYDEGTTLNGPYKLVKQLKEEEYEDQRGHCRSTKLSGYRYATPEEIASVSFPVVTIKGHTAKLLRNDSVKFGCQTYSKEFILQLNNCLQENGFKLWQNTGPCYNEDIQKIAEFLDKN